MLRKIGNKLERIEEDIFEDEQAEVVRDISNVKQEIINFRKVVRPQRAAFADLERTKTRYIADDLDIYFDDIVDASERIWDMLENYKEVVEALEETNESAISHRSNEIFRILTAFSVMFLPLTLIASIWGMNVHVPASSDSTAFYAVLAFMVVILGGDDRLLPQARLPLVVETAAALEHLAEVAALERKPRQRRMLVIVNPYATTMSDRVKSLVVYALQGRYDVQAVDTQAKGHAIELCREAAHEGYDVVVAFGGDGTVNEAANGLVGSPTPLTCLPGGATNVYCRMLGIPADVVDATEHLLGLADNWRERRVDLGRLDDRRFTFSAGMGLDASVVERVDRNPRLKARFGPWYFAQSAIRTFLERYVVRPPQARGRRSTARRCAASARSCRTAPPTRTSRPTRSRSPRAPSSTRATSRAACSRARARSTSRPSRSARSPSASAVARHRQVEPFSGVQEVRVRSVDGRPLPVHVDGDHISDEVDVRFTVEPQALRVIC